MRLLNNFLKLIHLIVIVCCTGRKKRNILNGLDINSGSTTLVLTLIELLVIRVFVNNYIIDIEVKNDLGKR